MLGSVLNGVYRASLVLPSGLPDAVAGAARESLPAVAAVAGPDESGAVAAAQAAFVTAMQATSVLAAAAVVAWRVIPSPTGRARPAGDLR